MNPAPSLYSYTKARGLEYMNKEEGAG